MSNSALLDWVKVRCKQADAAYSFSGPLPSPRGGFPQWETCEEERYLMRALGRVRRPAQGEEGYEVVVEVAFRGTENIINWFSNLNVSLKPTPMGEKVGKVHTGFAECYMSLEEDLLRQIQRCLGLHGVKKLSPSVLVLATGHSLGGALAQLLAYDLACKSCTTCCVSFGAPKVGDMEWKGAYNKRVCRTLRFMNKFDPVPRLPPNKSDPIQNAADAIYMGVVSLLARPLKSLPEMRLYEHTCPETLLDDGLESSMKVLSEVVSQVETLLGCKRKRGSEARVGGTEAQHPHAIRRYEENIQTALERARAKRRRVTDMEPAPAARAGAG